MSLRENFALNLAKRNELPAAQRQLQPYCLPVQKRGASLWFIPK